MTNNSRAPLAPILITAPGRSGTTMMMGLLHSSPNVVIAPLPPYEIRQLSYYASVWKVLSEKKILSHESIGDAVELVGSNPFSHCDCPPTFTHPELVNNFHEKVLSETLASGLYYLVQDYYHTLSVDQEKDLVTHFAEKNNNLDLRPREFMRKNSIDCKEIILIRDPRDLYCSRRAYFKQSRETAMSELVWGCKRLNQLRDTAQADTLIIKYEDMVRFPNRAIDKISYFLQITPPQFILRSEAGHATSATALSSINRWRADLDGSEIDEIEDKCRKFMEIFGYA